MTCADHALVMWPKSLKLLNLPGQGRIYREPKKNKHFLFENKQSYKMTDKITDKMTDGSQNRTNQNIDEINKECNDSFMSFLVYSFMKNMWSFPIA